MRTFVVLACCLALGAVARAEPPVDNKKKKKNQSAEQQLQATGKPGKPGKQPHKQQAAVKPGKVHKQQKLESPKQDKLQAAPHNKQLKKQQKLESPKQDKLQAAPHNKQLKKQHKLNAQNEDNVPAVQSSNQLKKQQKLAKEGKQAAHAKAQIKKFKLKNAPNPKIVSVKFKENNHIHGSEHWNGEHYVVFKKYRSQWHDRNWWHRHHTRVILIAGGYYYWNSGYWYPAWGYDSAHSYYPYDGPIYGYNNLPPDQVVANVQASLQAQGYYRGEVDGLLGPLTREALAGYQRDRGLYITSAIDRPTLSALGFA